MDYIDKNGKQPSIGDILYYNEGDGYAKAIQKIVERDGVLYSKTLFYEYDNVWLERKMDDVVELKYLCGIYTGKNQFLDAEIIDVNEDDIDIDWLNKTYPLNNTQ